MLLYELAAPVAIGLAAFFGVIAVFYLTRSTMQLRKEVKETSENLKVLQKSRAKKNEMVTPQLIHFNTEQTTETAPPPVAIPTAGGFEGFVAPDFSELTFKDSESVETDIQF